MCKSIKVTAACFHLPLVCTMNYPGAVGKKNCPRFRELPPHPQMERCDSVLDVELIIEIDLDSLRVKIRSADLQSQSFFCPSDFVAVLRVPHLITDGGGEDAM